LAVASCSYSNKNGHRKELKSTSGNEAFCSFFDHFLEPCSMTLVQVVIPTGTSEILISPLNTHTAFPAVRVRNRDSTPSTCDFNSTLIKKELYTIDE